MIINGAYGPYVKGPGRRNNVKIPKEIAKDSDILQSHISNVLRDLKEKNLVECLNPKMRKGRLYRLSEEGLEILDQIK